MDDRVKKACETCFAEHENDCSGFARAVAGELDVELHGLADQIVDTIRAANGWTPLQNGAAAATAAADGKFVIGGLKGSEQFHPDQHGHVVIVVPGLLARDTYPTAYWGKLGGGGAKDKTVNYAWRKEDRDRVSYAAYEI